MIEGLRVEFVFVDTRYGEEIGIDFKSYDTYWIKRIKNGEFLIGDRGSRIVFEGSEAKGIVDLRNKWLDKPDNEH